MTSKQIRDTKEFCAAEAQNQKRSKVERSKFERAARMLYDVEFIVGKDELKGISKQDTKQGNLLDELEGND